MATTEATTASNQHAFEAAVSSHRDAVRRVVAVRRGLDDVFADVKPFWGNDDDDDDHE